MSNTYVLNTFEFFDTQKDKQTTPRYKNFARQALKSLKMQI